MRKYILSLTSLFILILSASLSGQTKCPTVISEVVKTRKVMVEVEPQTTRTECVPEQPAEYRFLEETITLRRGYYKGNFQSNCTVWIPAETMVLRKRVLVRPAVPAHIKTIVAPAIMQEITYTDIERDAETIMSICSGH